MKRTGPLQRTTPLSSRAPLSRSTPLRARTPLRTVPLQRPSSSLPSQKPREGTVAPPSPRKAPGRRQVTPEERQTRKVVRERSGDRCERCGAPATNMSHRKPVSQGGKWEPSNILHVCGQGNLTGCHAWVHEDRDGVASRSGWSLKSWQDPAVEPVTYPDGVWLLDDEGGRRRVHDGPECE